MNEKEENEQLGPDLTLADLDDLPPPDDRVLREDGLSNGALFRAFLAVTARAYSLAHLLGQSSDPAIDAESWERLAHDIVPRRAQWLNDYRIWRNDYLQWCADHLPDEGTETTSAREFSVAMEELRRAAEDAQRRDEGVSVDDAAVARALLRLEYGVACFTDADSDAGASRANLRNWRA